MHESDGGQLLGESPPSEVVRHIRHWFTRSYISSYHLPGEDLINIDERGTSPKICHETALHLAIMCI